MSESAGEGRARRAALVAQMRAATGIDAAMIKRLVDGFYDRVRADELLAPVFAAKIDDWGPHLERMYRFWDSVVLMSGAYLGRPMARHRPLPIDATHFARWLELFELTARELCPPAAAEVFIDRARRMGRSLEAGVADRAAGVSDLRDAPPGLAGRGARGRS